MEMHTYKLGSSQADQEAAATVYALPIDAMPVLTAVIVASLPSEKNKEESLADLQRIALSDPCFASKILAAAQKRLGPTAGVVSVTSACRVLGFNGIREIVEPVDRLSVFLPSSDAQKHLWLHSLQVAALSEALAEVLTDSEVDPETAYTTGLLHDIGRFITYYWRSDLPESVESQGAPTPEDLMDAERQHSPVDHSYLGSVALAQWGFAGPVHHVVAHHHSAPVATDLDDPMQQLLAIVRLADFLSVCLMTQDDPGSASVEQKIRKHSHNHQIARHEEQPSASVLIDLTRFIEKEAARRFRALNLGETPLTAELP